MLLKAYKTNAANHIEETDDEQDDLFYNVKSIVVSKRFGTKVKYHVRWEDYEQ